MVTAGKVVPGAVEVQTLSWIQTQTVADTQKVTDIQNSKFKTLTVISIGFSGTLQI
ncbi:hypothetical protein [Nostoc sp.]|uniref:hypothetical protein n=1 Tax=Nostoc sp. TaxID=1180 RepID=UPI002FFB724F